MVVGVLDFTKSMLNSNQVKVGVDVGVELGNYKRRMKMFVDVMI